MQLERQAGQLRDAMVAPLLKAADILRKDAGPGAGGEEDDQYRCAFKGAWCARAQSVC